MSTLPGAALTARPHLHVLLWGTPWDLAHPSTQRASQVAPGPRSHPQRRASCLERTGRQGSRGSGWKASDSSGRLSPHPAEEPPRGENVAARTELSEAAERKRRPEGRGGGDRPVQVRSQRQAEGCQELGQLRRRTHGWLAARRHWPAVCSGSPQEGPLLGHSPARRWHPHSSQRPEGAPSLTAACQGSSLFVALPPTQYGTAGPSDMESNDPCGSCSPESRGDLPRVTKLAGGSIDL